MRRGRGGKERVKVAWSAEEDAVLSNLVEKFGARNWSLLARSVPGRTGKSCRLRWCNQLDPSLTCKPFSLVEDQAIIRTHGIHGIHGKSPKLDMAVSKLDEAVEEEKRLQTFLLKSLLPKDEADGRDCILEAGPGTIAEAMIRGPGTIAEAMIRVFKLVQDMHELVRQRNYLPQLSCYA